LCLTENTLLLHHKDETANEVKGRVAVHCKTRMRQCVSKVKEKVIMLNEVVRIINIAFHTVKWGMEILR